MQTALMKLFAVGLAAFGLGSASLAQQYERINFAKDGCCLVWNQRVAANSTKSFVFSAKKGQKLTLSFLDETKVGSMDLGKISIEPNTDPFVMPIEVTKDYLLFVTNNSNQPTTFRIFASLEDTRNPATANPRSERVQFAVGKTSVTLTREIPANGSLDFIINAKSGQMMGFTVGYDFGDSDIKATLTEPNTPNVTLTTGPKKPNEFAVKKTGDHRLKVTNTTGKKITFTLYLDIN